MIHNTAIIDSKAKIDSDVEVGPYAVIGPNVEIHKGCRIYHHASIEGKTVLHKGVQVFPFASVGAIPQDLKYKGEDAFCRIGEETVIRECATVNLGSPRGGEVTQVGKRSLLMAYSHLGHNAVVGDEVVLANGATLAGHVFVGDHAVIGGLVGVHQFVKIGKMVIVGGCTKVVKDIPPYMLVDGNPARVHSINRVGLQRKGYSKDAMQALKDAYSILFRKGYTVSKSLELLSAIENRDETVEDIINFIKLSERGITRGEK